MKKLISVLLLVALGVATWFHQPPEGVTTAAMGATGILLLGGWALGLGYFLTAIVPRIIGSLPPETQSNQWVSWLTMGAVVLGGVFVLRMILRTVKVKVPSV